MKGGARFVDRGAHRRDRKPGGGPVQVPAEHIADMRYLHEVERKTHEQIMAKYSQYDREYVRRVLGYIVRSSIKPSAAGI